MMRVAAAAARLFDPLAKRWEFPLVRRGVGSRALAIASALVATVPAFATWTDARVIGDAPKILRYIPERPAQIAVSGDFVHVVWFTGLEDRQALLYARSDDCGDTWTEPTPLAEIPFTEDPDYPGRFTEIPNDVALAVSGDSVHVFWLEEQEPGSYRTATFHTRSLDAGLTWLPGQQISANDQVGSFSPLLAASHGAHVFVVWRGSWRGRNRIIVGTSRTNGDSWSFQSPGPIAARDASWPALALDKGSFGQVPQAFVSFARFPERRKRIFHRTSPDGADWVAGSSALRARTPKPGEYHDGDLVWPVAILPQADSLGLVWGHGVAFKYGYIAQDLYYQTHAGAGWSEKVRINKKRGAGWQPAVVGAGKTIHAAWVGDSSEVWIARSSNRGVNWNRRRLLRGPHDGGDYLVVALAANADTGGRCANTNHAVFGGKYQPVEAALALTYRRSPAKLP